jgi:hypothetical protein
MAATANAANGDGHELSQFPVTTSLATHATVDQVADPVHSDGFAGQPETPPEKTAVPSFTFFGDGYDSEMAGSSVSQNHGFPDIRLVAPMAAAARFRGQRLSDQSQGRANAATAQEYVDPSYGASIGSVGSAAFFVGRDRLARSSASPHPPGSPGVAPHVRSTYPLV